MSSGGKSSPPMFGDDADSDKDNDDLFTSAQEKPVNNNDKKAAGLTDLDIGNKSAMAEADQSKPNDKDKGPLTNTEPPLFNSDDDDARQPAEHDPVIPESSIPFSPTSKTVPVPTKRTDAQSPESAEASPIPAGRTEIPTGRSEAIPAGKSELLTEGRTTEAEPIAAVKPKIMTQTSSASSGDEARRNNSRGLVSTRLNSNRLDSYDLDDDNTTIEILVSDPRKIGDGMNSYIVYRVTTRTNCKMFRSCDFSVNRRFSDFLGLHEKLQESYQPKGKIVPLPPEKSVMGTTKVKMTKEESAAQDFVEKRRASLERFLNRVAKHPDLRNDTNFIEFLEHDGDLPKATNTSSLSGAGIARLFNKFGDSLNKMTFTMTEPDQWFEDKVEEIETFDRQLKEIYSSLELLVIDRKELSHSTGLVARSIANLGSQEEDLSLSKALSSLAEVELKVEQLQTDQTDSDFFVFCELIKDYINLIQSIKEVLHERVKAYKIWQESESALVRKKEQKAKLEQQRKPDKQVDQDISDIEGRVVKFKDNFDTVSASIRQELSRFDRQRAKDFKTTLINYLQCMMNNQQQLATVWESFLPEAKLITAPSI